MPNDTPNNEESLEKENHSLKQKVDELEHTLSDIREGSRDVTPKANLPWWKIAVFGILVITCLTPSYLVLRDRWEENPVYIETVNKLWWESKVLHSLAYPQYFLLIFIATILAGLIVFFWRGRPALIFPHPNVGNIEKTTEQTNSKRHKIGRYTLASALIIVDVSAAWMIAQLRIPGWELVLALILFVIGLILSEHEEIPLWRLLTTRGWYLLDAALFVIALCSALYTTFGEDKPSLIFYLLLVVATINFLRHRKQTHRIFWLSIASLVALTWGINSWHYVAIGDEYSFFTEVLNILDNRSAWQLLNLTFNGNLVYGTHPYFSSYIQDLFMKLFDNQNFGWRFSNPVLVACALPLFYYFFKAYIPRRTALITVLFLGFSHYLLSFSKIGYNNLQAFFAMGLVLASFTWALKCMKPMAFALTGLGMGLCFYLYPAALYVIPLPVLGFLFFMPPTTKEALRRWGWMIISISLLAYPLLIQPRYWEAKIPGTFFYTNVSSSAGMLGRNILRNTLYSSLSYLYTPAQSHYVSIGYLDLFSSAFVIIGFAILLKTVLQKNKSALFLACSFLFMFIVVGATHGRDFPTATRMFLLLPWFTLFAVLGLEWSVETARSLFQINPNTIMAHLIGFIVLLNLYQTYVVDVRNMAQYHTFAPMFIMTAREIDANPKVPPKSYAFVTTPYWDINGMEIIQKAYHVPDSPRQFIRLPVEGNQLPASVQELVVQRDTIVIIKGDLDETLKTQLGIQLLSWGKSVCDIRNEKGTLQFQLWHSGDLGWLCQ